MPRYSFQVRTGDATISHGAVIDFVDLAQALAVAKMTLSERALRDIDATMNLAQSALEILNEDGDIVASLPIGDAISRH